jgi:hypothetical protein
MDWTTIVNDAPMKRHCEDEGRSVIANEEARRMKQPHPTTRHCEDEGRSVIANEEARRMKQPHPTTRHCE